MQRVAVFVIAGAIASVVLAPSAWAHEGAGAPPGAEACDPTREIEAAKRSAAAGDQIAAVEHLLRADAILAACEGEPALSDPGPESPERALAHSSGRGDTLRRG